MVFMGFRWLSSMKKPDFWWDVWNLSMKHGKIMGWWGIWVKYGLVVVPNMCSCSHNYRLSFLHVVLCWYRYVFSFLFPLRPQDPEFARTSVLKHEILRLQRLGKQTSTLEVAAWPVGVQWASTQVIQATDMVNIGESSNICWFLMVMFLLGWSPISRGSMGFVGWFTSENG